MAAQVGTSTKQQSLADAKAAKDDEFYTQLSDIEKELRHYKKHFKGKVVYLNCDDPRESEFFHYFSYNFEKLGLKKLIAACYKSQNVDLFSQEDSEQAVYLEYEGDKDGDRVPGRDEIEVEYFEGDGDFRSKESIALLEQADIVVTNPPFSLFREYIAQLIEHEKKFLIIGNMNAITTRDIWPLVQQGKFWLGVTRTGTGQMWFRVSEDFPAKSGQRIGEDGHRYQTIGNSAWFTNLDHAKRHEDLILYKTYDPDLYPAYDNFDAINVSKAVDIPMDFDGVMGVPVSFLGRHNPDQFEIVGITKTWFGAATKKYPTQIQVSANGRTSEVSKLNDGAVLKVTTPPLGKTYYKIDDECFIQTYPRILIRRKDTA
ncbi:adenine-specific methyltransferase EcoRI family protein [Isoptericola cucumis]|uniref:Adenine-specific methylase n=1 Tax=Isoptericola cucumis TaxID=1776856 RepID=A0ABQ2B606_9MICO|nr:adenine-specific methyltransferase EcoRI family protein [Isoptericola cucumis]GGI06088.1 putative adenine-specific methylase [Isoptericola cucumis]